MKGHPRAAFCQQAPDSSRVALAVAALVPLSSHARAVLASCWAPYAATEPTVLQMWHSAVTQRQSPDQQAVRVSGVPGHQWRLRTQHASAALAPLCWLGPWRTATNPAVPPADAALAPLSGYLRAALAAAENAEAEAEHHQLPHLAISSPNKVFRSLHGALLLYLPFGQLL